MKALDAAKHEHALKQQALEKEVFVFFISIIIFVNCRNCTTHSHTHEPTQRQDAAQQRAARIQARDDERRGVIQQQQQRDRLLLPRERRALAAERRANVDAIGVGGGGGMSAAMRVAARASKPTQVGRARTAPNCWALVS